LSPEPLFALASLAAAVCVADHCLKDIEYLFQKDGKNIPQLIK
jgi:hypothetical protein